jgi:hypothetical protein
MPIPMFVSATIANGTSLSAAIPLDGQLLAGVGVPLSSGWTDANLTFQASVDGGSTYYDLWKDGAEYTVTVPTGRTNATFFAVPPADFAAFTHIKVRSGTAGTAVAQGADRALQIGRMP